MHLRWLLAVFFTAISFLFSGCGQGLVAADFASSGPATGEPEYKATPTIISNPIAVEMCAKFLYRQLVFDSANPYASTNGLRDVVDLANAIPIPFAEFRVYDSGGNQVQQGETDTDGIAKFNLSKAVGTYTLKVFSRSLNSYARISILEDTYSNRPYSISKDFVISSTDLGSGAKDLKTDPVVAQANELISSKIEGGAFNIMFDILLANEYIRRQIGKDTLVNNMPSSDPNEWWVADKVTVYWKAGFNPRTYFSSDNSLLSFYVIGTNKLYILGGTNGNVKNADTDHFDDSVILHEYGHFLEDNYGKTVSPGGSHNGNFVIDPRLAWSEGWANYFQAAVLSGADNYSNGKSEDSIPSGGRFHFYIDTIGYGSSSGVIGGAFNLTENGAAASYDSVGADAVPSGIFREISISRTLYKSTRSSAQEYLPSKSGGGISFANIWKTFSGEDKTTGTTRLNPAPASFRNNLYPIPNAGLFNYLLDINVGTNSKWQSILTEERQTKTTADYAYFVDTNSGVCSFAFNNAAMEVSLASVFRSNPQTNNDFFLYYHNGSESEEIRLDYVRAGAKDLDLDLIVYNKDYVYFEDAYVGKYTSPYIVKQSRRVASLDSNTESVTMSGLTTGWYVINVKINAFGKTASDLNGTATYTLKRNGTPLCGKERSP